MQKNSFSIPQQALQQARRICSNQEKCKSDIRRILLLKNIDKEDVERIINQLIKEKFIDEKRYAQSYVNDKLKFSRWGRIKIRYELKMKGVSDIDISIAFENIEEDSYNSILVAELKKKLKSLKGQSKVQQKAKLIRFAASKGFENDLIFKFVEKLIDY